MYKLTTEDYKFVLDNFDNDGCLKNPSESQILEIKRIINSGCIKYKYSLGYYVVGSLRMAVLSKMYSELLGTNMVALC